MFDSEMFWGAYHTDKINITNGEYLDSFFKKIQEAIESAKNFKVSRIIAQKFYHNYMYIRYPNSTLVVISYYKRVSGKNSYTLHLWLWSMQFSGEKTLLGNIAVVNIFPRFGEFDFITRIPT